jgi:hypothetical protein
LALDKEASSKLEQFIAYKKPNQNSYKLLLGPIFEKTNLDAICKDPKFLVKEGFQKKVNMKSRPFKTNSFEGCIIEVNEKQKAIVIKHPKPFTDQQGQEVNYVGIVSDNNQVDKIINNISFELDARAFYVNLLQIGNAFSPFASKLDWNAIKQEGLRYIGRDKALCKGTYAAAQFYLPKLYAFDHHSFISLNGLGTAQCPLPKVALNSNMQKWLAEPEAKRKRIIDYSQNFHGKKYGDIAYVYIPAINAFSREEINKSVTEGRRALNDANIRTSSGLIIDLRYNLGGSIGPMLLTLGGVLSPGKIFGTTQEAIINLSEDGNTLTVNDQNYAHYEGIKPIMSRSKPVAILTNSFTASSGEIAALGLKNNIRQSKIFGSRTSGQLSTNATFFLWDGNSLNLTFDRIYNPNGQPAPLSLSVDKETTDNLETIFKEENDITIKQAINWLHSLN